MTPEQILSIQPKVLTQKQRETYFENGYILLEKILDQDWWKRLQKVTEEMIGESRGITQSDEKWDLEPGHSKEAPRLRRLSQSRPPRGPASSKRTRP